LLPQEVKQALDRGIPFASSRQVSEVKHPCRTPYASCCVSQAICRRHAWFKPPSYPERQAAHSGRLCLARYGAGSEAEAHRRAVDWMELCPQVGHGAAGRELEGALHVHERDRKVLVSQGRPRRQESQCSIKVIAVVRESAQRESRRMGSEAITARLMFADTRPGASRVRVKSTSLWRGWGGSAERGELELQRHAA
jgi:hypothetical protein